MDNGETTVGPWQVRCGPLAHKEDPDLWIELRYCGSDGAIDFAATLGPHEALAIGTALVAMARTAQTQAGGGRREAGDGERLDS